MRGTPLFRARGGARAFAALVAALTFLAALAAGTGAATLERTLAWRRALLGEATIQIRARPGRDLDAEAGRAAGLARAAPGIAAAEPVPAERSRALLDPWLGPDLDLGALPVPRLVTLTLAAAPEPDLAALGRRLAEAVPGAVVVDGRQAMGRAAEALSLTLAAAGGLVLLLLAASGLAVAVAARGAMADHRRTVAILDLVGAERGFIVRLVRRRFLALALPAALAGGGLAILVLAGAIRLLGPALVPVAPASAAGGEGVAAIIGAAALVAGAVVAIAGAASARAAQRFVDDDRDPVA